MKPHLKTGFKERTTVINEDGEILEENVKTHTYVTGDKEQFFLGYVSLLSMFYSELGLPEIKVYSYILQNYSTVDEFALIKHLKDKMVIKTGLKIGTINNSLYRLVEKRLLYTTSRSVYKINPRFAFKGSSEDRKKQIKLMLELECPDC